MRKLFLLVCTVGLFALFGTGSAMAGSPCPTPSPNAGGDPACGVDHNQPPPACNKPNAAKNNPNCPPPQPPPPPAECGVASEGGTAAQGPISSIVYEIGAQISAGGGAPLGDLIQQVACALDDSLGL
jgi:hypothetical protein